MSFLATPNRIPLSAVALVVFVSACSSVTEPGSGPSDFSSGNFRLNIVASDACTALAAAGHDRSWNMGLVQSGSVVSVSMQGWDATTTVVAQTDFAGTANGSSLTLTGGVFDTIYGCATTLCYRADGTIKATQSGKVLTGTLSGAVTYEFATCTATDHKVTLTRR
jgi:hypothetical protein